MDTDQEKPKSEIADLETIDNELGFTKREIDRIARNAKKSREASLLAAKLNAAAQPSRTYRRRQQFVENQYRIDVAVKNITRKERRKMARGMVKATAKLMQNQPKQEV